MREILFRGKDIYRGKWIEGAYVHLNTGNAYICDGTVWIGTLQPCKNEVIPDTVGQYTGLTDKNGNKIFEGDILSAMNENIYAEVKYNDEKAAFFIENDDGDDYFGEEYDTDIVIVGNIHDNPELLEQED